MNLGNKFGFELEQRLLQLLLFFTVSCIKVIIHSPHVLNNILHEGQTCDKGLDTRGRN